MAGAVGCALPGSRPDIAGRVESYWSDAGDTIAAYSVRSGFDLLLQALDLEDGDEVLFSALNVKGMIKIARRHGLTPVPLDLDIAHFAPSAETLEAAITTRSKVLVVAHLFGCLIELDPLFELARRHGLTIVEDCAQTFNGRQFTGHPEADVSMFSFGPLKTATALGGALIKVRDRSVLKRMRDVQAGYPVQKNRKHFKRVVQFAGLKFVSTRPVLALVSRMFTAAGKSYDDAFVDRARNVAPLGGFKNLRHQPSIGMLRLMERRMSRFAEGSLAQRADKGRILSAKIGDAVVMPGQANTAHNYWVFPLLVDDPQAYIAGLRRAGFDSSDLPRSQAVAAPDGREELEPSVAAQALSDLIIVPCYPGMPDHELARQADTIARLAHEIGTERTKAYARSGGEAPEEVASGD